MDSRKPNFKTNPVHDFVILYQTSYFSLFFVFWKAPPGDLVIKQKSAPHRAFEDDPLKRWRLHLLRQEQPAQLRCDHLDLMKILLGGGPIQTEFYSLSGSRRSHGKMNNWNMWNMKPTLSIESQSECLNAILAHSHAQKQLPKQRRVFHTTSCLVSPFLELVASLTCFNLRLKA